MGAPPLSKTSWSSLAVVVNGSSLSCKRSSPLRFRP